MKASGDRLAIATAQQDSSAGVPPPRDPRLVQALEDYLAAFEAGATPDRQQFLARHAEIAGTLAECLDGLDFIRAAASQVREPVPERPAIVADRSAELQPEGPLGDFRIVREIGRGGMGVVYEAVQISLGRTVALKVLPFASALDHKQLQRFKNEAQAAATLHHTNIVPVHAVGTERGVHYYAMQFIEGQSLALMIHEMRHRERTPVRGEPRPSSPDSLRVAVGEPLAKEPLASDQLPATLAADNRSPGLSYKSPSTPPVAALSTQVSHHSASYFRSVANLGVQAATGLAQLPQFAEKFTNSCPLFGCKC